jgi:hypothetical protein
MHRAATPWSTNTAGYAKTTSSVGPILELSTTQTLGSHLGKSWRRGEEWV